jgi:hypothetical protein
LHCPLQLLHCPLQLLQCNGCNDATIDTACH